MKMNVKVQTFRNGANQGQEVDIGEFMLEAEQRPVPMRDGCISLSYPDIPFLEYFVHIGDAWWLVGNNNRVIIQHTYVQFLVPEYITPTDEDAKRRPEVEACLDIKWEPCTLYARVMDVFWVKVNGCNLLQVTRECRMRNPEWSGGDD